MAVLQGGPGKLWLPNGEVIDVIFEPMELKFSGGHTRLAPPSIDEVETD